MAGDFYLFFGVLARKIIHQRKLLQSGLSIEILDESAMRRVEVSDDSMSSMGKENKEHRTTDLSFGVSWADSRI